MIKKIELSLDKLEPLVQLDDESVGKMLKAIYHYVLTQEVPDFGKGNQLLPFVFSIYKPFLDAHRSAVNSENAKGKAVNGSDKSSKNKSRRARKEIPSEEGISLPSEPIANQDTKSIDSAPSASTSTSFEQIEAIYPKKASVGAYRDEALATWANLDESERIASIAYVPTLSSMPNPPFLNQYLETAPWRSAQAEDLK